MSPQPLPPVPDQYQLPFHYGALHQIGLDFLVDPDPVRDLLAKHHPALSAAEFADRALVSLNYQLYFAQYPFGGGITEEVEVNIVAFPTAAADRVPEVTYEQYAQGFDQTRLLGIARIHVLCDNPLAIDAGRALYAEPKYPGWFEVELPSLNGQADKHSWTVHTKSADITPAGSVDRHEDTLFSFSADLGGLAAVPANNTPVTGYGTDSDGRALAGPMNLYQPYHWYDLSGPAADRTRLTVHDPAADVGRDLTRLVGDTVAAGAWTYQSPPVAAHNRPYYLA
ncbi:hypothetical protein AB0M94_31650 [Streptomyces xanthochromogenes]|uniref:Uncharacterized protein n=1 Tax=Streptomyces xanthochromogenes TaxID=67384 RepID=A0ABQ3ARE1_9ACTN|nr:hypothetical protein [Streptomyces xanthochromogenes]GGY64271.1 hypothetical protein GCM10010326_68730 [Streptomyces xanthochromogenes]